MAKTAQRRADNREHDARRRAEQPWRAWYKTDAWRKGRAAHLATHPLCEMCRKAGRTKAARILDHITPHRGDMAAFFNPANWQSLCKDCHDIVKQRAEQRGYSDDRDDDGWPTDARHPANATTGGRVKTPKRFKAGPAAPAHANSREIGSRQGSGSR